MGHQSAVRYQSELEARYQQLADAPSLGRLCDEIRAGLQRFEYGRHIVFYRQECCGILISRILHQRMLPERHSLTDD